MGLPVRAKLCRTDEAQRKSGEIRTNLKLMEMQYEEK